MGYSTKQLCISSPIPGLAFDARQHINFRMNNGLLITLLLLGWLIGSGCNNISGEAAGQGWQPTTPVIRPDTTEIYAQTFQTDQGWGYDIYYEGKRYIRQPYLPAVGGNQPFASEAQARKVGEAIVKKMGKGIFPPALTPAEVDSLVGYYPSPGALPKK